MGSRASRAALAAIITTAIAISATAIATVAATAPAASAATVPRNRADSFLADAKLLARIPDAVRETCLLQDTTFNSAPGDHYVAFLECRPDPSTTITYRQYERESDMSAVFTNRFSRGADKLELVDEDAGCASLAMYTVDGKHRGSSICKYDDSTGAVSIAWTYEPLAVIGVLERGDNDAGAARKTWTDDAGPSETTHSIPSVLAPKAAKHAASELLGLIPHARANRCHSTDLSNPGELAGGTFANGTSASPAIWLDAEVVCRGDYPTDVVYRRYRNDDAYAAAYDSARFLQFSETSDPACPGGYETSWSLHDVDVGRVACYYLGPQGEGEAHLLWTYDPDRIVGEATALQQPSAQALFDWWTSDAGPQP
jgi:hypothetical protein